jgi:uncharacterized UPF0160 family protein
VDRRLIQALDATDNGQRLFEGGVPAFEGVSQVTLSGVIAGFNPCSHESQRATVYDTQFQTAVSFATRILDNAITSECGVLLAEAAVKAALDAREDKRLLVLDAFLPWQETAVKDPDVVYTVFKDETGGTWMVQAVPPVLGSFDKRKPLPAAWAGLRDSEFSKAVGISDGVFCHPGAFICGARSKESALRIAQIALEAS